MGHVDGCATAWAETSAGQETASSPSNSYWDSDGFRGCGCSHPWACLHIEASFLICGVHVSSHDVCYGHIFMRPNHETVSAHHFLCIAEPTWHHVLAMTFSHGSFVPVHGCLLGSLRSGFRAPPSKSSAACIRASHVASGAPKISAIGLRSAGLANFGCLEIANP